SPVCRHAAQPHRGGNRDAVSVGEPVAERTRTRDHRGPCAQRAFDRGEPSQGRSAGCPDPGPVGAHRSAAAVAGETQAQADLRVIRARAGLVRARTALINTARGLTKSYGERLRGCNVRNMNPEKAEGMSPELQAALQPLLAELGSLGERIA